MKKNLLLAILFMALTPMWAVNYTTSGNYSTAANWNTGSLPSAGDPIVVNAGVTLTVDVSPGVTLGNISLKAGATMIINFPMNYGRMQVGDGATLTVNANVVSSSQLNNSTGTVVINSNYSNTNRVTCGDGTITVSSTGVLNSTNRLEVYSGAVVNIEGSVDVTAVNYQNYGTDDVTVMVKSTGSLTSSGAINMRAPDTNSVSTINYILDIDGTLTLDTALNRSVVMGVNGDNSSNNIELKIGNGNALVNSIVGRGGMQSHVSFYGNGKLSLNGDFSPARLTQSSGTIAFVSNEVAGAQNVAGNFTYGNLEFEGQNQKRIMDSVFVTGLVLVKSGTLNLNDKNSLFFGPVFVQNGTLENTASGASIFFFSGINLDAGGTLNFTNTSQTDYFFATAPVLTGSVNGGAGTRFVFTFNNQTFSGAFLSSNSEVSIVADGITLTLNGDYYSQGNIFIEGSGKINSTDTIHLSSVNTSLGNLYVNGSGNPSFSKLSCDNLFMNSTGNLTFTQEPIVSGLLEINSGNVDFQNGLTVSQVTMNDGNLSDNGDTIKVIGGTGNTAFVYNGGTLDFTGVLEFAHAGNTIQGINGTQKVVELSSLYANNGSTFSFNNAMDKLVINETFKLNNTDFSSGNDTIVLKADSTSPYATLVELGTSTVSGNGIWVMEHYVSDLSARWRQIAFSVDNPLVSNIEGIAISLLANKENLYEFNSSDDGLGGNDAVGWSKIQNNTLDRTKGYYLYAGGGSYPMDSIVRMYGTYTTPSDFVFDLNHTYDPASLTKTNDQQGWNLIPNPYPSNISIAALVNDLDFISGYKGIHIWDALNQQNIAAVNGVVVNYNANTSTNYQNYIRPNQSFWVKSSANLQTIRLKNSMRDTENAGLQLMDFKKDLLRLIVKNPSTQNTDEIAVYFKAGATSRMDEGQDAYKLMSANADVPSIYMSTVDGRLSINAIDGQRPEHSLPLGFEFSKDNKSLEIDIDVTELNPTWNVYLEDLYTGDLHDLRTGAYQFTHSDKAGINRFVLHINHASMAVKESSSVSENWFLAYGTEEGYEMKVTRNINEPTTIMVVDMLGRVLYQEQFSKLTREQEISIPVSSNGPVVIYFTGKSFNTYQKLR